MNRFLLSLYIICLVHAQVPQNCVKSMIVNDIDTSGSHLARIFDNDSAAEYEQQQQKQHHSRHDQIVANLHHRHHHHNQRHHNSNHDQQQQQEELQQQIDSRYVDAGNHNDVEIGHTQPNMVNVVINKIIFQNYAQTDFRLNSQPYNNELIQVTLP